MYGSVLLLLWETICQGIQMCILFVQTRSHKKSVHPAFFVKWTNFLEFLRILGFNIIVWVFVGKMLIKFGFHMGTLLYGIVFLSIGLNTLIR